MKRIDGLFSQVVTFENLYVSAHKALKGKKDKATVGAFYFGLENEIIKLQEELVSEEYQPRPFRQFEIREPKVRNICSSDFRDRVVHHAICNILDPLIEARLIHDTYACRVGKGGHAAMRRAQQFARKFNYFLKCDIQKYFESIDHKTLREFIRRLIKDRKLLALLDKIISHQPPDASKERGLPIGNLTSQHFANLYLGVLDHWIKEEKGIKAYVRYMDDFICFANEKAALWALLEEMRPFLWNRLKLTLKEKVTRISPVTEGVPFLGFHIFPNMTRIQRPNLIRLRRKMKAKERAFRNGQLSLKELQSSVGSMIAHISHTDTLSLRRKEFLNLKSLA